MKKISMLRLLLLLLAVTVSFVSCTSDDEYVADMTEGVSDGATTTLRLSVATDAPVTRATVDGTNLENYIDYYRVFLYDTNNYYICELQDTQLERETTYTDKGLPYYYLEGTVSSDIIEKYDNIKVVFIANWLDNPGAGEGSTIEDLCSTGACAFYSQPNSDAFYDIEEGEMYVPFYGVREYDDIHSSKNQSGTRIELLGGELYLLRALAKVEIIFDDNDMNASINEVRGVGYVAHESMCAPSGVYHQDDYADGVVSSIHLYSGYKWFEMDAPLPKKNNRYYAYLGEWDNMGSRYLYFTYVYNGRTHKIYFANYTNGVTTAYGADEPASMPDRYNICRNMQYTFYVSSGPEDIPSIAAVVSQWTVYTNYVEYNLGL